jgi:chorismate synthase
MGELRMLSAGESHGAALVCVVDGLPAGVPLSLERINAELKRRQQGYGRGGRMRIESDEAEIFTGVRFGKTTGAPVAARVINRDAGNWLEEMAPFGDAQKARKQLTRPRPGHADLAGALKHNHKDARDVLERASARHTTTRVLVGALCKELLSRFGIDIVSRVIAIGEVQAAEQPLTLAEIRERSEASPVRCTDTEASEKMCAAIDAARKQRDSLGGVFEVVAEGVPVGLGSYAEWDRRIDGRLAQALVSIPAIKGVEIGDGWRAAATPGSRVHDPIAYRKTAGGGVFHRTSNRAGGSEGGMSNGERLVVRAAMKPIPTLAAALQSVDIESKESFVADVERTDSCAVPAAAVVGESAVAWVLAHAMLEKFGGDSLEESLRNARAYAAQVEAF